MDDKIMEFALPIWPYAYGGPSGSGNIKTLPDDFIVEEILPFTPEGSGEHVFLHIEKINENTEYVARLIARHAGVRQRDIGYAGLKDRHGRTRQWFSIWLPGQEDPDWSNMENDNLKILAVTRHARKLKRGVLTGNRFEILIRHWQGKKESTETQLESIQNHGFPNYFGEQRFGHQGRNIEKALAMFQGAKVKREQRSIYLSAARSYLFNLILAERVKSQTWNQAIPGDLMQLDRSHSFFHAETLDATLVERVETGDIHPTGALFGKGKVQADAEALALEQRIFAAHADLTNGLLKSEVEADRRPLRVIPKNLLWRFENNDAMRLSFELTAGSYATALLREIITNAD